MSCEILLLWAFSLVVNFQPSAQCLSGQEVAARPRDSESATRSSARFGRMMFALAVFYATVFPLTCTSFPLLIHASLWQGTNAILRANGGLCWSICGGLCRSLDHLFLSGPLPPRRHGHFCCKDACSRQYIKGFTILSGVPLSRLSLVLLPGPLWVLKGGPVTIPL